MVVKKRQISVEFVATAAEAFTCPWHGVVHDVITSGVPGYEGKWCTRCWVEMLMERHVCRVTRLQQLEGWGGVGTWPQGTTP